MEKLTISQAIEKLHEVKELNLNIFKILEKTEFFDKDSSIYYTFYDLYRSKCEEQAVIYLIKQIFPKARFGFDYNPSIQPDKNGRERCAQGWVRIYSETKEFNPIDWSISHKFRAIAMLIALLHVIDNLRQVKAKAKENN